MANPKRFILIFPLLVSIPLLLLAFHQAHPFLSNLNTTWSTQSFGLPSFGKSAAAAEGCDPYFEPGYLNVNTTDISQTFWQSFNPACPRAPHYLSDVLASKPLPFMQGKTVLMVGDSIDRNHVEFFCHLVGRRTSLSAADDMTNLTPMTVFGDDIRAVDIKFITHPRVCAIEEYDFELWSFAHYGLSENGSFVDWRPQYTPPALIDERILHLLKPMWDRYHRKPDMILMNSGLWDLMNLAADEDAKGIERITPLNSEQISWHSERLEYFVDLMESAFPNVFKMWRMLHECSVIPSDDSFYKAFNDWRVFSVNQEYLNLLRKRPILHPLRWGELIRGTTELFQDHVHPGMPVHAALFGDMLLYYLSKLGSS